MGLRTRRIGAEGRDDFIHARVADRFGQLCRQSRQDLVGPVSHNLQPSASRRKEPNLLFGHLRIEQNVTAMRCLALLRCLFCLSGCTFVVAAQSVRWEVGVDEGPTRLIHLVFDHAEPVGRFPLLPPMPGVAVRPGGMSQYTSNSNEQKARSPSFLYTVQSQRNSPIVIPEFEVMTDKGALRVASAVIPPPSVTIDAIAVSKLKAARTSVWTGEVFDLSYEIAAPRKRNPQFSHTPVWAPAIVVAEPWSKPVVGEVVLGGEHWVNVSWRSRAVTRATQAVQIEPAYHEVAVIAEGSEVQTSSPPRMQHLSVWSNFLGVEVRPLPPPPADFSGAVGQFELTSHVVPEQVTAGEPITWTLTLSGTGNWLDVPTLPRRQASNDFDVVVAKPKHTSAEGNRFDIRIEEDAVLFPSRPGTYVLGSARFIYFDPQTGKFVTITTPTTKVTVTPGPPPRPVPPPALYPAQKPGERTFGGTSRKVATSPGESTDAKRDSLELKLEELRKADSPPELFRKIRKAEGKDVPATGKD